MWEEGPDSPGASEGGKGDEVEEDRTLRGRGRGGVVKSAAATTAQQTRHTATCLYIGCACMWELQGSGLKHTIMALVVSCFALTCPIDLESI